MQESAEFSIVLLDLIRLNLIALPNPNDTMYDDEDFADRFRYQLTMYQIRMLIVLSHFLHDHIAYEIVI